jgi:hypothetical protein
MKAKEWEGFRVVIEAAPISLFIVDFRQKEDEHG